MNFEVVYTAAHAEFPDTEPLGGGKAVADYLIREWRQPGRAKAESARRRGARAANGAPTTSFPFELTVLSPRAMGMLDGTRPCPSQEGKATESSPPPEGPGVGPFRLRKPLTQMTEFEYARFCRQFERVATDEILRHDPRSCVVLSNDISEGPHFALLGQREYRVVTIFHVDVVAYFTAFYLRNLLRAETAARFRWFRLLPDVLRLVFQKQSDCVRHSARIVVPSTPMRETILRCYPWCPPEKIAVLPWGNLAAKDEPVAAVCRPDPSASPGVECDRRRSVSPEESALIERRHNIAGDEFVILTLSRLSPEKGIERLLKALRHLGNVKRRLHVFICGGAAYMKGHAYERKLRRLAAKITNARVDFTGHVTGDQKAALLWRADLFVSPSRHESYGLTIAEAQAAGCRVISHNHYGASGTIVDCSNPASLANAIRAILATGRTHKTAAPPCPSRAAEQLAELLVATAEL